MIDPARCSRSSLRAALALAALGACTLAEPGAAQASNLLGLYVGAAYGQAHVRAGLDGLPPDNFPLGEVDGTHSAYQAMLGIRVLSFLGAEVTYVDLGQVSTGVPGAVPVAAGPGPALTAARVSQKGEGAFALLYLPVPVIDVYVKAGVSHLTTDSNYTYVFPGQGTCQLGNPNCATYNVGRSSSDDSFAYGAGLQWKLGSWAVRGEYERFRAAGADPTLLSIGMTYWFL